MVLETRKQATETIKVLLVEDDPDDVLIINDMLDEATDSLFHVIDADRLEKGLGYLGQESFDVALVDLGLPDSQSLDTLDKIKSQAPDMPIIVLTGLSDEEVAFQAVREGAQDYMVKGSINSNLLERSIRYAIERKRTEKLLITTQESFRKIVEDNSDGILIMDKTGVICFANAAAEIIFGRNSESLLGQPSGFAVENGEKTEIDVVRGDGETRRVEMHIAETEWEGKSVKLASLRDITERKRTEEALRELDRMRAEFISNISHELRTPLQSITGFSKLMLQGKVPDPEIQKEFLGIIERQGKHLGGLVDNLLDMSRLESGRFQIQKQCISLKDIISNAVSDYYRLASEKSIIIHEDIPSALPEMMVDGQRIGQVMFNLLSNALKFSPDGGEITVTVEIKDSHLLVKVSDHGIGIPQEAIPHLFERFYRVGDLNQVGGSGLGLHITKHIIEKHDGHIWVESKPGEGSTFSFTLPLNHVGGNSHGQQEPGC